MCMGVLGIGVSTYPYPCISTICTPIYPIPTYHHECTPITAYLDRSGVIKSLGPFPWTSDRLGFPPRGYLGGHRKRSRS